MITPASNTLGLGFDMKNLITVPIPALPLMSVCEYQPRELNSALSGDDWRIFLCGSVSSVIKAVIASGFTDQSGAPSLVDIL